MALFISEGLGRHPQASATCAGEHIVLLGGEHLPLLLQRLSNEKRLRSRVKGILVGSGAADASIQSPADKFPLATYAPYKDRGYPWNPNGTGISNLDVDMPIFHLDDGLAVPARSSVLQNSEQVGDCDSIRSLTAYYQASMEGCRSRRLCIQRGRSFFGMH